MGEMKVDFSKLYAIQREMQKSYYVKVGILAKSAPRREVEITKRGKKKLTKAISAVTNVEIGMKHEFGCFSENLPMRSFLRVPLWLKLPGLINKFGQSVIDGLTKSNILSAYKRLGLLAETIIDKAFLTRGYGQWKPSMREKFGGGKTLIDTGQLRRSITSQVVTVKR